MSELLHIMAMAALAPFAVAAVLIAFAAGCGLLYVVASVAWILIEEISERIWR